MVLVHLLVVNILLYHLVAVLYVSSTSSATTGNIDWTQDTSGQANPNSLQSQLNKLTNIASSAI